jgi:oxalate decarboxylase/phosphoglucose isomerase-like protein (cupin superfamily)
MGRTGIIDRDMTVKDTTIEKGMTAEIIASDEQCESNILFYVYGVLEPGTHTEPHVHDNCEIAWFLEEGEALWAMGSVEDADVDLAECEQSNAGYVAPGELHMLLNPSNSERAVFLMAYVGINNAEAARGRPVALPDKLKALIEQRGFSL